MNQMQLNCTSDVAFHVHPFGSKKENPGSVRGRMTFEFPDAGQVVHPTIVVEAMKPNGDWSVVLEIDVLKSELLMALDICKRLEES